MTKNDSQKRRTTRNGGFTLIELLIVVAIIGIIAAILIPNLLDALQKSKQKRTMSDLRLTGTALMSWLSDLSSAAAAGRGGGAGIDWASDFEAWSHEEVSEVLVPQYATVIPEFDSWKSEYDFGFSPDPANDLLPFGMRSPGSGGEFDSSYVHGPFIATDFSQDIVWAAGYYIRWPSGLEAEEDGS